MFNMSNFELMALVLTIGLMIVFAHGSSMAATTVPMLGASLNHPLDGSWPWKTWDRGGKEEVDTYFAELRALNFNAVRKLIGQDVQPSKLLEFIDLADAHGLRVLFWIDFRMPSTYGVTNKDDDPGLYHMILDEGKQFADNIIGYLARKRTATSTIIGWTIGNGENLWAQANCEFVRDIIPYVRSIDPYHPIGSESYNGLAGCFGGQILGLHSTDGNPEVVQRSFYDEIDYLALSAYDLSDGVSRAPFSMRSLLQQVEAQNPLNKPVLIEEYGIRLDNDPRATFVTYLFNTTVPRHGEGVHAVFIWDAHQKWNNTTLRPDGSNNWGLFWEASDRRHVFGSAKDYTKVLGLRNKLAPWACYTFDESFDTGTVHNAASQKHSLSLLGDTQRVKGKVGLALELSGEEGSYAITAADPSMSSSYLYFEAWINPTGSTGISGIVSRWGVFATAILNRGFQTGRLQCWANTGSGWEIKGISTSSIPLNKWTHVAVSYDGIAWRYYINGVLDVLVEDPGALVCDVNAPLFVGTCGSGEVPRYVFKGVIDEVMLSAIPPALIRFACNEGKGSMLFDDSANGLNASLHGGYGYSKQIIEDGYSVGFDGIDTYAIVPGSSMYRPNEITVDLFIQANEPLTKTPQLIVSQGEIQHGSGWGLYLKQGKLFFEVNVGGSTETVSTDFKGTDWCHIHASYDGKVIRLAVNGHEMFLTQENGSILYKNNLPVVLGSNADGTANFFNGHLDEIEIYSVGW